MSDHERLELSTLIQGLRDELATTWWEGRKATIGFEAGPVEVEVTIVAEKSREAKAGVKFWVVEASGGGGVSSSHSQRIKLTLTPRDRRDPNQPLRIAGAAVEDEE